MSTAAPLALSLQVDVAARTVEGVVVPYNSVARTRARRYRFAPGSLRYNDVSDIRLLREHCYSLRLGRMTHHEEQPYGTVDRYLVDRGRRGDEALDLALNGQLGFSVGVDVEDGVPDPEHPGVTLVLRAFWRETSLTESPAFHDEGLAR